jgi:hypothetical protein
VIPAQHHRPIIDEARRAGIPLEPADFFVTDSDTPLAPVAEPIKRIRGADVITIGRGEGGVVAYLNGEPVGLDIIKARISEHERSAAA